jgi:hypothetical protein
MASKGAVPMKIHDPTPIKGDKRPTVTQEIVINSDDPQVEGKDENPISSSARSQTLPIKRVNRISPPAKRSMDAL